MIKLNKILFLSAILLLGLVINGAVLAQEDTVMLEENQENDQIIDQAVALDEDVEAKDLDIGEPIILPDNPFYFLKNWTRGVREVFALSPVVKAELKEKFANEKLVELREMIKRKKDAQTIKRASDSYEKEVEEIGTVVEKIKEKAQENPQVEKFLDKFVKHQILHQKVLQKLENQVPAENMEKIREMREKHLQKFGEVMTKLEDRQEKIRERLEIKMEEIEGSEYKNFKNLEILSELEEKVPEQAKEAIRKVQENTLRKFKTDLKEMSVEKQEKFGDYLEKISGAKENQVKVLENIKSKLEDRPEIQQNIIQSRDKILQRVEQKVKEEIQEQTQERSEERTQEPIEEKKQLCISLWDPVCGSDERTYSNDCFAKVAGVQIEYRGACKQETTNPVVPQQIREQIKERVLQKQGN